MHSATIKPLLSAILFSCCYFLAQAQTTISGTVTDIETGEPLIGVNILVQGSVLGTITDYDGNFNLNVASDPPLTLTISSVGYERQELEISNNAVTNLSIKMTESFMLGQEVVVSASRVEESILQSPVSIEKMDILDIQNSTSDDYYKSLINTKGVDMTSSSINFQIINARGFASTGNTRFVQLIDGMDTQAPALNFPIGNLNGPSVLDVESMELIPGASSALYGPNAFNGVLLVNSKNAFDYQGASAYVKMGVNHVGSDADRTAAPVYSAAVRYAKAYNNKFAFKVNFSYSAAQDWHATSDHDRNASLNPFASLGRDNPGTDIIHKMGDEAGLNLAILKQSTSDSEGLGYQTVGSTGSGVFAPGQTGWLFAQNGFLPNHVVTTPGFDEVDVVDYGAENFKANAGLYYRLSDKMELSYLYNAGFGTSIYTGAQRYSLSNFGIQQHRLQLRGDNFFVRGYTTLETSGDSYIAEFLGVKSIEDNYGSLNGFFTEYANRYLEHLYSIGYRKEDDPNSVQLSEQADAHDYAREVMLSQLVDPNSKEFEELKKRQFKDAKGNNLTVPNGPLFNDKSSMNQIEGQYDFKNQIDFIELQAGGSLRSFVLNSNGTIFADTTDAITIREFGAYVQAGKRLTSNLKLSGSVRFDKNENFDGQVNPRLSAVYTFLKTHNIRASVQTGFRNPTTQGQHIDLDILSSRLLGGLPQYYERYGLPSYSSTNQPLTYTESSVQAWRNSIFAGDEDRSVLTPFENPKPVQPEKVRSIELGYKGLINNKILVDFVYYYNLYTDFITQISLVNASEVTEEVAEDNPSDPDYSTVGNPYYLSMLLGSSDNTFFPYTNLDNEVTAQGAALGISYNFSGGYNFDVNYNWNKFIGGANPDVLNDFNTPEHKFNVSFGNRKLTDKLGFNVSYRWQEKFRWESTFAVGDVPAYGTLDAQLTYKLPDLKSKVRVGGSNILNKQYYQSLGGPNIGAIYYVSITFDELMN
ncbi:MAG: TonB-dependent receptor [Cyclobacteriaceae bacterium]